MRATFCGRSVIDPLEDALVRGRVPPDAQRMHVAGAKRTEEPRRELVDPLVLRHLAGQRRVVLLRVRLAIEPRHQVEEGRVGVLLHPRERLARYHRPMTLTPPPSARLCDQAPRQLAHGRRAG